MCACVRITHKEKGERDLERKTTTKRGVREDDGITGSPGRRKKKKGKRSNDNLNPDERDVLLDLPSYSLPRGRSAALRMNKKRIG